MKLNILADLLNIKYPIIQAPMAGGITTSKLVAEVSETGALGMIGAGYLTPYQLKNQIIEIRKMTSKPFGVNLFVPQKFVVNTQDVNSVKQILDAINKELNVTYTEDLVLPNFLEEHGKFNEQIKIIMDMNIPVCSFTFGIPSKEIVASLQNANVTVIGTATTVEEAMEVEKSGVDIIVAQGAEAGGHRGSFINESVDSLIGLMSLVPQVTDTVSKPVVAAGGIMDGRGLMASLCLGAVGVQMGTAFLTCDESGAHDVHKDAILNTQENQTTLTRSFSGKWSRGIKNKFIVEMREHEDTFPVYPVQNSLTQLMRKASSLQNNKHYMSLWSGQSPKLAKRQTVESLIQSVIKDVKDITSRLI
ncbi:nitronate monooxygenase [Niallia taxi]|uniref:NAD(P)H-dependent flavin oxidoreductase n=1 Tax=Niallia taxi TaxID=2499688 RepID=UPI00203EF99F|nr:nitronate monooxygenase [Niallia taxi]MCM3217727.1 nitronate monooxygenase [Niallia taxi]